MSDQTISAPSAPSEPLEPVAGQTPGGAAPILPIISMGVELVTGIIDGVLANEPLTCKLADFLGRVLAPIVSREVKDAFKLFKDTAVVSQPNPDLERAWDDGVRK